jgi:hypothetical protein
MSAAPALAKIRKISVEVVAGPLRGEVFHFSKPLILVGRGLENDVTIEKDSKMSRMHFEIRQNNGLITVHNVTEKNSLLVDGQLIKTAAIDGDVRVLLGDTELLLRVEGGGPTASVPRPMQVIQGGQAAAPVHHRPPPPPPQAFAKPPPKPAGVRPQQAPAGKAGTQLKKPGSSGRVRFYVIIGIVFFAGFLLLHSGGNEKKKEMQEIRNSEEVQKELKLSSESSEEIEKRLQREGVDQLTYQTAQQQYIRGFRDYRQGQYGRAIHELRAALTYYQQHELARHYLTLAQKKQDEMVREEMNLGKKYRGQGSYHMCVASFKKVVMLLDDPEDKISKEAKQYWNECELQQRERY